MEQKRYPISQDIYEGSVQELDMPSTPTPTQPHRFAKEIASTSQSPQQTSTPVMDEQINGNVLDIGQSISTQFQMIKSKIQYKKRS